MPSPPQSPLAAAALVRARVAHQRLIGEPLATPEEVVGWLGAMQSQDYTGAVWAVGQRLPDDTTEAAVDQAFDRGAILRTHVLRPTWHFVLPRDARWLLALTGKRVHAANASYYRKLDLDERVLRRAHEHLSRVLEGGHFLTRDELASALKKAEIDAAGIKLALLVMHAELEAVVISGPRRGKQHTYALFDERVPKTSARDRDDMVAELVRRYLTSHGPATTRDFAWWSGLTGADAKRGIDVLGRELASTQVGHDVYWHRADPSVASSVRAPRARPARMGVHLLPNYDEYLVAYRDRALTFDERVHRERDWTYLLSQHFIVSEGRLIGGWRRKPSRDGMLVEARWLTAPSREERRALARACQRYSRFLGRSVYTRDGE